MTDLRRESLLDHMAETEGAYLHAAEWSRRLAQEAPHTPCHMAAVIQYHRANIAWIKAREALEDYDWRAAE